MTPIISTFIAIGVGFSFSRLIVLLHGFYLTALHRRRPGIAIGAAPRFAPAMATAALGAPQLIVSRLLIMRRRQCLSFPALVAFSALASLWSYAYGLALLNAFAVGG